MKPVAIYARYSSHNQTECSIEGQLKVCYEYAKKNKLTVIHEYIDRATTGTNDNREQFQQMIRDSEKKHFQGVLVYQLDRFARNRIESAINEDKLNKNGVEIISAKENLSNDPSGKLLKGVIESVNEYYSNELSVKVKRGMGLNADKCYYNGGSVPIGLKLETVEELNGAFGKTIKKKKFVIDEETAPIVRKIFEMYNSGSTIVKIKQYLETKGLKYSVCKVRTVLGNKKYIGIYTHSGKETPNVIPQIIDNELFEDIQKKLEKNKHSRSRLKTQTEYILTTKLFCGNCKEMMVGVCGTSKNGKIYNYYSCNNSRRKKCHKQNVSKEYIENVVVERARNILTDEHINEIANKVYELAQKEMNDNTNFKRLNKQLKENEQQNKNLMDSLKTCNIDSVRQNIFAEMQKMEEQRKEIEKELLLENMQKLDITVPEIIFFLKEMRKGKIDDINYCKMLINALIYKVYLYDDNLTIIFNSQDKPYKEKIPSIEEIEAKLGVCSNKERPAQPSQ